MLKKMFSMDSLRKIRMVSTKTDGEVLNVTWLLKVEISAGVFFPLRTAWSLMPALVHQQAPCVPDVPDLNSTQ